MKNISETSTLKTHNINPTQKATVLNSISDVQVVKNIQSVPLEHADIALSSYDLLSRQAVYEIVVQLAQQEIQDVNSMLKETFNVLDSLRQRERTSKLRL